VDKSRTWHTHFSPSHFIRSHLLLPDLGEDFKAMIAVLDNVVLVVGWVISSMI